MLTGHRAFQGEDVSLTLSAVLQREPDWSAVPSSLPSGHAIYLRRCLEKDPRQRVQAVGDLRLVMEGAFEVETAAARTGGTMRRQVLTGGALVATGLLVGIGLASVPRGGSALEPDVTRLALTPPFDREVTEGQTSFLEISPDGRRIAYRSDGRLYLRELSRLIAVPIEESDGAGPPFFSPDSAWIGFPRGATLNRVAISGGPPVVVCQCPSRVPSWSDSGRIVFADATGLLEVPSNGGEPARLTTAPEGQRYSSVQMLPGGRAVLVALDGVAGAQFGGQIAVEDLATQEQRILVADGRQPRYSPRGHLVFLRGESIYAVPFDSDALEVTESPVVVLEGVLVNAQGIAQFWTSDSGTLMYVPQSAVSASQLAWVDREGRTTPLPVPPGRYSHPRVSPDGQRIAVTLNGPGVADVAVCDAERGGCIRLTSDGESRMPSWTPDGTRVAFSSQGDLHWTAADGSGRPERLLEKDGRQLPYAWTPDGATMTFIDFEPPLGIRALEIGGEARRIVDGALNHDLSPDGRWIAYNMSESGFMQIFIEAFPELGSRLALTPGTSSAPAWSRDGSEIFHVSSGVVMVAPIETDPVPRPGPARTVFDGSFERAIGNSLNYDVDIDDSRLLMVLPADEMAETISPIVVQNWHQELLDRVPIP